VRSTLRAIGSRGTSLNVRQAKMKLYQYHFYEPCRVSSVEENMLWLSKPSSFNDIFDSRCAADENRNLHELREIQLLMKYRKRVRSEHVLRFPEYELRNEHVEEVVKQIHMNLASMLERFGVSCFSEIHDSQLMWSHYANKHSGFCVEYEVADKLTKPEVSLQKVHYSTGYVKFDVMSFHTRIARTVNDMLTTKSADWSYEQEWRLIYAGLSDCPLPSPFKISRVYFGARMSQERCAELKARFARVCENFSKMDPSPTEYRLLSFPI
jgi:hypothetical protein